MYKQDLNIGVITATDPNDKTSWSGTLFRMNNALKEEFSTVISLGPVELSKFDYFVMYLRLKICKLFHKNFYKKKFNKEHNHIKSKYHSGFFDKAIQKHKIDVLFAPAASVEVAHLKTNIPICYFSDATVSVMVDYYDSFANFSDKSIKISNQIEQKAISKSTTQVFPSKWVFDIAQKDYDAQNPYLVKMGANIDKDPEEEDLIKKYDSTINILFVGVDWKRKGGDIVLETIDKLDKKGYNVKLTVVGCIPSQTHPKMEVIPFLNKNFKEDNLRFQELFKESHLFFMPTRAECFGIVFCEANAYGLPVITTDTGGVSSVVENGINGFILPLDAKSDEYFDVISNLISDTVMFKQIAETSREKYLKELNWKNWGKEMKKILTETYHIGQSINTKESQDFKS
ncbi:hypothetical protein AXE80_07120 [Wenyingzhuangia fucanilytica]|uniref:Glycosyl transferase family 1 domain-containing protein n=1 Tax=Wenyingzhuangia fucanilytica TaxID=1790137 RepID=A0A1B1Y5M6_9FLAO|nr:glycosyltransferase family 4 protein [Wenyingzhuangia fucanilytica]ANW96060.1 hypothetical protein AXE80_07120 [Wenyingzhuangia fucanilytica]